MRIAVIALGSRGDVQPYMALGKGLEKAGHAVRLITHENFAGFAREHVTDVWPVPGNVQDVAQSSAMRERLDSGNFLRVTLQMAREARRTVVDWTREGLAACRGMELILTGIGGLFIGTALAERLGIPLLQAYYIPFTPTRGYPSFLLPNFPQWFGGALNPLSYGIARQMMWQGLRPADSQARREVLELDRAPFWGPFHARPLRHTPLLYGYSPTVIPKPPDWGADVHVTGYWFLDQTEDWSPPADVVEFLEAGPPPVFVGFGSMSSRSPERMVDLILSALAEAGQRGIILSGWAGLRKADAPDSVFMVDSVPFSWLFPRVAAVVHHGGAGTTSAGLRAGVPSLVIPFFGDQPFWGQRVAALGAGPNPIPRKKLTAGRMAQTIRRMVTDRGMRERAARVGERIRAEDGVARAVEVIHRFEG